MHPPWDSLELMNQARIANGLEPIAEANGEAFSAFHRFVGHGPRDDNTTRDEFDFVVGVEGSILDDNVMFDAFRKTLLLQR